MLGISESLLRVQEPLAMALKWISAGFAAAIFLPSMSAAAAASVPCAVTAPATTTAGEAFNLSWSHAGATSTIDRDGYVIAHVGGSSGSVQPYATSVLGPHVFNLGTTVNGKSETCSATVDFVFSPEPVQGYDIIIVAGQSNAAGRGQGGYTDPLESPALDADILQIGRIGESNMQVVPVGFRYQGKISDGLQFWNWGENETDMSFALSFAHQYAAHVLQPGRKVLIIPAAEGGTSILQWLGVHGPTKLPLYSDMMARVDAALALPGDNRVVAFLWQQGEADVINANTGQYGMSTTSYKTDLTKLFAEVRTDIGGTGSSTLPIIAGLMVPGWLQDDPVRLPVKHAIQNDIISMGDHDPYFRVVSSSDLYSDADIGMNGGAVHFDAQSQVTLGQRYFKQYVAILNSIAKK